jgi:predicted PurR-regulated permease PerM
MAVSPSRQLKIWGGLAVLLIVLLWALGDVLLPYVLGAAVAYFLDPIADWLERMGFSRVLATVTISLLAVLTFAAAVLVLVPSLIEQAQALVEVAPRLFEAASTYLTGRFPELLDAESTLRQSLAQLGEQIRSRGTEMLNTVLGSVASSAASVINVVLLIVIVPVVAFYLLLDWDRLVGKVDALLPREHAPTIRGLMRDIDRTVAAFVRGMGTVCLIMGVYYAVGLMLVGLQFGLVIGVVAGIVTFIPYVGAFLGGALAMGLGLFQFWGDWVSLGLVAAVFVSGQALEGNVITPNLVGRSVSLHPVWLLLALSVFGSLFGFVGMLIAVPLAAAIGVLVRHAASAYRDSTLYRGTQDANSRDSHDPTASND